MRFAVEPPVATAGTAGLGRLDPALSWLAGAQGAWPPAAPSSVQRVRPGAGLQAGVKEADRLADAGADLVVLTSDDDPVPGVAVAAALLDLEPVAAVGTAGQADWAALTVGVRDGLRRARAHLGDPVELLEAAGSPAVGFAAGLLAQCAVRRTPVLLDGSPVVCGAALVAERLAPGGSLWWLAGAAPPNPAAARALADLDLAPLLDLRLGGPLGAELALTVLLQAVEHVRG